MHRVVYHVLLGGRKKVGGGGRRKADVNGGRLRICEALDDMDIYSEKLILTLNA